MHSSTSVLVVGTSWDVTWPVVSELQIGVTATDPTVLPRPSGDESVPGAVQRSVPSPLLDC
jgi:hypothetical protein